MPLNRPLKEYTEGENYYASYLSATGQLYVSQKLVCLACGKMFWQDNENKCPHCRVSLIDNLARADFYLPDKNEIVEVIEDLTKYHDTEDPDGRDQRRKKRLEAHGYRVRFITNKEARSLL